MPKLYRCSTVECPNRVEVGRYCEGCTKARNSKARPNKAFYDSREWKDLARTYKAKNPKCQWLNKDITACSKIVQLCDHILPLEQGGEPLAWANIQSLCGPHHSTKTSREVRNAKPDIFVVCGAAGSGKTTLVDILMQPGELVIDIDRLKEAFACVQDGHLPITYGVLSVALHLRTSAVEHLRHTTGLNRAWVIDTAAAKQKRFEYRETLGATTIVLTPTSAECKARVSDRTKRVDWPAIIDKWFNDYEEDEADLVFTPNTLALRLDSIAHARVGGSKNFF